MTDTSPPDRNLMSSWTPWIVVLVVLAAVAAFFAVWSASGRDRKPAGLSKPFVYDIERYRHIPPDQIGYRQTARIDTTLRRTTAICVGPEDEIVVGGDRVVLVHDREGTLLETIEVDETPLAMTVAPNGGLFVGFQNKVVSGGLEGPLHPFATIPGSRARITSIAVAGDRVYVADAGSRDVWPFVRSLGKHFDRFGVRDPFRDGPLFSVPSPYFDLLMAPDGLLRIADPGRHRVTAFTTQGDLEIVWGHPSITLPGFSGCCNPSHIAVLPDGSIVTSEKGIPRIKVYDEQGAFVTAVASAEQLSTKSEPCDVAADSKGRILVLDPGANAVRIYEPDGRSPRDD